MLSFLYKWFGLLTTYYRSDSSNDPKASGAIAELPAGVPIHIVENSATDIRGDADQTPSSAFPLQFILTSVANELSQETIRTDSRDERGTGISAVPRVRRFTASIVIKEGIDHERVAENLHFAKAAESEEAVDGFSPSQPLVLNHWSRAGTCKVLPIKSSNYSPEHYDNSGNESADTNASDSEATSASEIVVVVQIPKPVVKHDQLETVMTLLNSTVLRIPDLLMHLKVALVPSLGSPAPYHTGSERDVVWQDELSGTSIPLSREKAHREPSVSKSLGVYGLSAVTLTSSDNWRVLAVDTATTDWIALKAALSEWRASFTTIIHHTGLAPERVSELSVLDAVLVSDSFSGPHAQGGLLPFEQMLAIVNARSRYHKFVETLDEKKSKLDVVPMPGAPDIVTSQKQELPSRTRRTYEESDTVHQLRMMFTLMKWSEVIFASRVQVTAEIVKAHQARVNAELSRALGLSKDAG